jgi:hypothetical protein
MTKDEEMAEEYICNGKCQDDITRNYVHCKTCTRIKDFLAGLKAGRPQWHDLRKDPNDLPKEHIPVLVILESGVPDVSFVSTDKRWFCTDYYTGEDKVIAWCEIPTFDKE